MKRAAQIISSFLALCLILGGVVGGSPTLHVWAEHGGQGAPHVHRGMMDTPVRGRAVFVPTSEAFVRRAFDFNRFTHALHHALAGAAADVPAPTNSGHEHHSFVQLLAGGLVDCAVQLAAPAPISVSFSFHALPPSVVVLAADWNAQTASRGPPTHVS